jgi:hypothetical protein
MDIIDKYIPDFSNLLLNQASLIEDNYFLLLSEENINISANPFISSLLSFYLKNNINVILLPTYESLHHYSSILKKFGQNLNNNESFSCIDLFYYPFAKIIKEELPLSESYPYTYNPNRSKNYFSNVRFDNENNKENEKTYFETILKNLENQLNKFSNKKTVIILDQVSILPFDNNQVTKYINKILELSFNKVK